MKEKYISDVNRLLDLPKRRKAEIIRDLDEIFRSASEHGESEREVISRLGTADEYAQSVAAEHEDERRAKKRFRIFAAVLCGLRSAYSATGSTYERISARAAAISSSDGRRAGRATGISNAAYLEPA